jgi:hypothetical protein
VTITKDILQLFNQYLAIRIEIIKEGALRDRFNQTKGTNGHRDDKRIERALKENFRLAKISGQIEACYKWGQI